MMVPYIRSSQRANSGCMRLRVTRPSLFPTCSPLYPLLLFTAFCCLLLNPTTAQAQEQLTAEQRLLIPPNRDGATEVFVDIWVSEIFNIDAREEIFTVDAHLYLEWFDERLAFDAETFGYDRKVYQDEAVEELLKSQVWWPAVEVIDARGVRDRLHTALTIYADGSIYYRERFIVLIEQGFDLAEFPFDEHTISFTVEPFEYAGDEVIFTTFELDEADGFGSEEVWETREWDITYHPLMVEPGFVEADPDAHGYAAATTMLTISRVPNFYLSSFVLPLLLIVAISWSVFWMDYNTMNLADRMSVSFTSVLTIVAFDFVTSDSLPKLPYATLLDTILTASYIFLGLTVLENVIGYSLRKGGWLRSSQTLDWLSRILFPVGYIVVLAQALLPVWDRLLFHTGLG